MPALTTAVFCLSLLTVSRDSSQGSPRTEPISTTSAPGARTPARVATEKTSGSERAGENDRREHVLTLRERVLCSDDGLLLGNGDLSVSVYQTVDRIIWRFGKGDVWDRRLDLSDDPKPAHIQEIAHGIAVEGWKCPPYGGPVEATRGTSNPRHMKELCQGTPPSYTRRPFPCPKPVGELVLQLPPDQVGLKIDQRLSIERATLAIVCTWESGVRMELECFVAPKPNASSSSSGRSSTGTRRR